MNKSAIKNFAIWARNKLIADITYKAGLLGISEKEIKEPLPQSTKDVQFFDIGTKEPYSISGVEIKQREALAKKIRVKCLELRDESKAKADTLNSELSTLNIAFKAVVEEVAYTWFNRLIAVRFMEVNEYIPSRVRVISSESAGKDEPDLVTNPFETDLDFTPYEKDRIVQMKQENQLDELFRLLFIKQCNALNAILPNLFEKTSDYTELLLNVAFTDKDGVVYHLVHDIPEADFKIRTDADEDAIERGELTEEEAPSGQVEIIGWLYQYYNTEPKNETFALLKKNVKITKERIPAATQLFTPDWIVRYMVENSLGRIFVEWSLKGLELSEAERNEKEKALADKMGWKYYLPEAEQEPAVRTELNSQLLTLYTDFHIENVKIIDPCMGSGHILVYAFDILMQMYESCGYSQRDAAKSIIENNIFGLDIDNRAYQLAYFAVMMKARQYNRRILNGETNPHVYAIQESNSINRGQLQYFGAGMDEMQRNIAMLQIQGLLDSFIDAKEYGSILHVDSYDWKLLHQFVDKLGMTGQMSFDTVGVEDTQDQLRRLVKIGTVMALKYDVVVTNPPYVSSGGMGAKLSDFVKKQYPESKSDLFAVFIERCEQMTRNNYFQAMITMQSWMFLSSFEGLRKKIIDNLLLSSLVQIGYNSFPEINSKVAQAVAFVVRKTKIERYLGNYLDLTNKYPQAYDKEIAFFNEKEFGAYYTHQENFLKIPGMPIAYWVSETIIKAFTYKKMGDIANPRQGLATGENDRFTRLWYEIGNDNINFGAVSREEAKASRLKWFPYNKGGEFRKWYGNNDYVVNWEFDGLEIRNFKDEHGKLRSRPQNMDFYFKPSITWSKISSGSIAFRYKPAGHIFDVAGTSIFANSDLIKYLQGFCNSCVALTIANILSPTLNYEVGHVASFPISINDLHKEKVEKIVCTNIAISKNDWDSFETSWDFIRHPLIKFRTDSRSLADNYAAWEQSSIDQFNKLKINEEELNRLFIDIYGLQNELTPEVSEKDVSIHKADLGRDIRSFLSYAVGCMFGRYSLDVDDLAYAGGQWDESKYRTFIPDEDNILPITDEEYFEDDIVGLFVAFVKKVYGEETLEENLDFIAKALGSKGNTSREIIRNYFLKDFFKDHCKVYQKRPIYWLFDSGKADSFKALIYMHRYDENTIGNLRIDYLHKMQRVYEREIARMQETIDNSANAREVSAAEKRKDKLIKQLKETKEYDEKVAHLALARIAIDLDDGVKVNYEKVQTGTDGKKLEVLAKI